MVLYILIGFAVVLAVIFIIVLLQYCRAYRTVKEEELDGLVGSKVTPEEYEVSAHSPPCLLQCCNWAAALYGVHLQHTHTQCWNCIYVFIANFYKFQWRLLGITWKEKVRNKEIRKKTRLRKLELIIRERWLRWLGHVLRIENSRTPRQAIQWELSRATRESRDGQGKTGWTSLDEIWRIWTLLGMKPKKVTKYHTEHN